MFAQRVNALEDEATGLVWRHDGENPDPSRQRKVFYSSVNSDHDRFLRLYLRYQHHFHLSPSLEIHACETFLVVSIGLHASNNTFRAEIKMIAGCFERTPAFL